MNTEVQAPFYRAPNLGTLSYRKSAFFETSCDVCRNQGHDKRDNQKLQQMQSNSENKIDE
jgi:hypothetical protein